MSVAAATAAELARRWRMPVEEGFLRAAPLQALPALLHASGVEPLTVLEAVGLDHSLLEDPDALVAFPAMGRLLEACAQRTGCEHFGLLVGQASAGPEALGLVGLLARHSPDVGTALRNLILHLHLHDRGAVPNLLITRDVALLGYAIYAPATPGSHHIYDGAMAIAFNLMKALCGPGWQPIATLLPHRRPPDPRPYRAFFGAELQFDSDQAALAFPASWLAHPLTGADPQLRALLEARIAELEARGDADVATRVRRVLRTMLVNGKGSLQQVSALFDMHRRTLNRRLRAHGTTFRDLVEEVRFEIARQLIENTSIDLVEIAATLDYADASAFTRAFRRWTGTTPGRWRSRARAQ